MSSPTKVLTFPNYTPDRFARLEATMPKGLKVAGDAGEVKDFGADVDYAYNAATQTLTLTVKHGPHLHNFDTFCADLQTKVLAVPPEKP
jgi:hypothetical protein